MAHQVPAQQQQPLAQQPNFGNLANAFSTIAQEVPHFANVSTVQQGQMILNAIHAQSLQTQAQMNQLQAQMSQIQARCFRCRTGMSFVFPCSGFSNYLHIFSIGNANLRTLNAQRYSANHFAKLIPLRNITTGVPIPNFPVRVGDLDQLDGKLFSLPWAVGY